VTGRSAINKATGLDPVSVDPWGDEPAEMLFDEKLNVGEIIVEELALALDPYPRLPDVTLTDVAPKWTNGGSENSEAKINPFSALKDLAILKNKIRRT
jgi:uncharacterized metal-binding protein YceD (DUF177 family)